MDATLILNIVIPIATFVVGVIVGQIGYNLLKKRKHGLTKIKTLNHDTGMKIHEAYKNIKVMEKIFKELENA